MTEETFEILKAGFGCLGLGLGIIAVAFCTGLGLGLAYLGFRWVAGF